jgi:hypothetical protein
VLASIAAGAPPTMPAHHSGARRCCRPLGVCRPPAAQAARRCFRSPLLAPSAGVPPTRLARAGRPLLRPTAQAAHRVARLLPRRRTQAGRRSGTPRQPQLSRPAPLARCWSRATSCRRWSKVARASCGAGLSRPLSPHVTPARRLPAGLRPLPASLSAAALWSSAGAALRSFAGAMLDRPPARPRPKTRRRPPKTRRRPPNNPSRQSSMKSQVRAGERLAQSRVGNRATGESCLG